MPSIDFLDKAEFLQACFIISIIVCALIIAYLFQKWLSLRKKLQSTRILSLDVIEDPLDVNAFLNKIIQQKARLIIRLNNRGESFNSALLKIDTPTLLIDALFPYEGNELIDHSDFINVKFIIKETDGIPYKFNSSYIMGENFKGYPALKISLPNSIERDQKRYFHRVEPSVIKPFYIKFFLDGSEIIEKVANISGGGVGFYTNLGKSVLWQGRHIDHVSVTLPGSPLNDCRIVVKTVSQIGYPVLIDGKPYHYYCGAEFVNLDDNTRDKIIRYVIEKERAELRRLTREFE